MGKSRGQRGKLQGARIMAVGYLFLLVSIYVGCFYLHSSRVQVPQGGSPLRVYLFPLISDYNVGIVDSDNLDYASFRDSFPPWPSDSVVKKQHSVEYWMMGSLFYDIKGERDWREAVMEEREHHADVFFLPFFSSLLLDVYGFNSTVDWQSQEDAVHYLHESTGLWSKSGGRDHVIPMHHPNAFKFFREQINTSIHIVGDSGRYPQILGKDVLAPCVPLVDTFNDEIDSGPFESRTTLLFFLGQKNQKDEGIVRVKLAKILANVEDVQYEQSFATEESIKMASQKGMRSSKFCLHIVGDIPPLSCSLGDAIVSHCIPAIVGDETGLPFVDDLDYTQFSIFFPMDKALEPGYIIEQLQMISRPRWLKMWKNLKTIAHHFEFQYPPKKGDAVHMVWRQVKRKVSKNQNKSLRLKMLNLEA